MEKEYIMSYFFWCADYRYPVNSGIHPDGLTWYSSRQSVNFAEKQKFETLGYVGSCVSTTLKMSVAHLHPPSRRNRLTCFWRVMNIYLKLLWHLQQSFETGAQKRKKAMQKEAFVRKLPKETKYFASEL